MRMYQMQEKIPNTRENAKKHQGDKDWKRKANTREMKVCKEEEEGDKER